MTDALVLVAMAHPLRRRILDVLAVDGPCTVSAMAERTDQAVGNVSHHLRVLGEAGLVQPAPELARDRRERWWRRTPGSITWISAGSHGQASSEAVDYAAASLNLDRQVAFVRQSWAADPQERALWREGAFSTDVWLTVTPAELTEFAAEINEVMLRWSARVAPDDGAQRHSVFAFARAVPARP